MTEITKFGNNELENAYQTNSEPTEYEPQILTKETLNEQIKNYLAILTKQLEYLIMVIQEMSRVHQVSLFRMGSIIAGFTHR